MISRPEMVAVGQGDDSQLVVGCARVRIDDTCEVIVSDGRAPIAVFAGDEFRFTVAGEIAKADEGGMAGEQYALAEITV